MRIDPNNKSNTGEKFTPAQTGNASNPSAGSEQEPAGSQLLDQKAETYLRESGNIEDLPDENDDQA